MLASWIWRTVVLLTSFVQLNHIAFVLDHWSIIKVRTISTSGLHNLTFSCELICCCNPIFVNRNSSLVPYSHVLCSLSLSILMKRPEDWYLCQKGCTSVPVCHPIRPVSTSVGKCNKFWFPIHQLCFCHLRLWFHCLSIWWINQQNLSIHENIPSQGNQNQNDNGKYRL